MPYLTEERFIELLNTVLDKMLDEKLDKILDKKLDKILDKKFDEKLKPIYDTLKKLEGFQKYEAEAIEYEFERILQKYIKDKFPKLTVKPLTMSTLYDPYTGNQITDLDAAFLLVPYQYNPDYSRLKEAGIEQIPKRNKKYDIYNKFILAEAKHHLCRNMIATKLWQFDKIVHLFQCANKVIAAAEDKFSSSLPYTAKFISTVQHHRWLAEPTEFILLFGAACWEKGVMSKLRYDVIKRDRLQKNFNTSTTLAEKKGIYEEIRAVDKKWYTNTDNPSYSEFPVLSDDDIMGLQEVEGAMQYIKFIHASGDRFTVEEDSGISGVSQYSLHGGKTRKNKKDTSVSE